MNSPSTQIRACAAIGLAVFLVLCALEPFNQIMDDAYISLIYARNCAAGNGLTYEGGARVEGYSNLLWTLLCACYYRLPGSVFAWMRLGGLLMVSAIFLYLARLSLRDGRVPWYVTIFPLALLSLDKGFIIYVKSGMETPLHALLIVLCVYYYSPDGKGLASALRLAALLALLSCTRPEGAIFFCVLAAHQVLWSVRDGRGRAWARLWIGLTSVMIAVLLLWRYRYYGELLPNTYYAKVDLGSAAQKYKGFGYLFHYAAYYLPLPVSLLVIAGSIRTWRRSATVQAAVLVCIAQTLFIVAAGGDFFPWFRFFAPIAPVVYYLAAQGLASLSASATAFRPALAAAAILISLATMPLARTAIRRDHDPFRAVELRELVNPDLSQLKQRIGVWLAANHPPRTVIATDQAGQIPYYSRMKTIDLLGINDPVIARAGASTSYLLANDASIIIMELLPRTKEPVAAGLVRERDFQKHYRLSKIIRDRHALDGRASFVMWRRDDQPDEARPYTKDIRRMFRDLAAEKDGVLRL